MESLILQEDSIIIELNSAILCIFTDLQKINKCIILVEYLTPLKSMDKEEN